MADLSNITVGANSYDIPTGGADIYVVEENSITANPHYRKWNNGIIEVWGKEYGVQMTETVPISLMNTPTQQSFFGFSGSIDYPQGVLGINYIYGGVVGGTQQNTSDPTLNKAIIPMAISDFSPTKKIYVNALVNGGLSLRVTVEYYLIGTWQ